MIIVTNSFRVLDECYKSIPFLSLLVWRRTDISMKFAEILQHWIMTQDSRMGINLPEQLSFVLRAQ